MATRKEVKLLLAQAQSLIKRLNSFETYLESLDISSLDDTGRIELKLRVDSFKPINDKYDDVFIQLQANKVERDDEAFIEWENFNDHFMWLYARAEIMLAKMLPPSGSTGSVHSNINTILSNNAKLPKIKIPTFDGNYSNFTSFYEIFVAMIHGNHSISSIEKFYYLSSSLVGNAKNLISNISPSGDNYKIAFDLLCERYKNPKLIIQSHVKNIFDLKSLTKETAGDLRSLHDELLRNVRALQNFEIDTEASVPFIVHILMDKFDIATRKNFSEFSPDSIPSLNEINQFLKQRCVLLEDIERVKPCTTQANNSKGNFYSNNKVRPYNPNPNVKQTFLSTNDNFKCPLCGSSHFLYQCSEFLKFSVRQRFDKVSELNLCKNCLKHTTKLACKSKFTCSTCHKRHHSLLHFVNKLSDDNLLHNTNVESSRSTSSPSSNQAPDESTSRPGQVVLSCLQQDGQILLATAVVKVKGKHEWYNARCLLDSASQQSYMSENLLHKLQLPKKEISTTVLGINSCISHANGIADIQIQSLHSSFQANLSCLILPKITESIPSLTFNKAILTIPQGINLADETFNIAGAVDILIGASVFYDLLKTGQISLGKNKPTLQETTLGWILAGNMPFSKRSRECNSTFTHLITNQFLPTSEEKLEAVVSNFWQLERVVPKSSLSLFSKTEQFCEVNFIRSIRNDETGRYVVSIPFNAKLSQLGDSRDRALNRFLAIERKLTKDPVLYREYSNFIQEYVSLGHMTKLSTSSESEYNNVVIKSMEADILLSDVPPFYLPHHAVLKSSSLTTKIRIVFDASAKSDSGISLNDTQIVGPVIQNDLFSILLQFRKHKIALTGDIEKAYRQILIEPSLRKLQRIMWRDNPCEPIDTYNLNTVTYGTASASYLTTRCLKHLADSISSTFPKSSAILQNCFYVDDLLTGGDSVEEVLKIKSELTAVLAEVGFPIRKFLSNNIDVLSTPSNTNTFLFTVPIGERENAKTLGVSWNSVSDTFQYHFDLKIPNKLFTKRALLAIVSQIFDPLGILQPIIIQGKLLIQKLWQRKLGWDDSLPWDLHDEWNEFYSQLSFLNSFKVPRCFIAPDIKSMDLIGFSDASSTAFGACVYLRCESQSRKVSTLLVCAKSRVAPLHGVTIPRLELCAALLLAELMQKVIDTLSISFKNILYYSDSTIVLHWIHATPHKYKTFVANRIASIQELSEPTNWHHVESKNNPADLVSRGVSASELLNCNLWFSGPSFLIQPQCHQHSENNEFPNIETEELKSNAECSTFLNTETWDIFSKFSQLRKLQRVVAWLLRFVSNSKNTCANRITGPLTTAELQSALTNLIKLCQSSVFANEVKALKQNQILKSRNIQCLKPFLDDQQILRVGGRLHYSTFPYDKRFPILLPKGHIFSKLVLKHYHETLLHCGAQQLLACTRENFWPLSGKCLAKEIIHNCVKCFKAKPRFNHPLMGDLPYKRLQPGMSVFSHVGIDYAGPILLKDRKLRGSKLINAYICLFVCLTTKAIHLELVTDLTTNAFLATLKRFIGRRGKPVSILSDNATNFTGAANLLRELNDFFKSKANQNEISNFLANQGITWQFITPKSPHTGGIWESGVKSTKFHLRRVLGNTQLNYEDFQTLLIQIESVLNSRPLCPLSTDPSDLNSLTCGHFLIGKPLIALPEPELSTTSENRLSHYQRIQRIVQDFWKRWSLEVVPELQRRTKWFSRLPELLQLNSVVLLKEDNLPPLQWRLGRIIDLHRSSDSVVRSISVRIANGNVLKRSVHNVCVLPC